MDQYPDMSFTNAPADFGELPLDDMGTRTSAGPPTGEGLHLLPSGSHDEVVPQAPSAQPGLRTPVTWSFSASPGPYGHPEDLLHPRQTLCAFSSLDALPGQTPYGYTVDLLPGILPNALPTLTTDPLLHPSFGSTHEQAFDWSIASFDGEMYFHDGPTGYGSPKHPIGMTVRGGGIGLVDTSVRATENHSLQEDFVLAGPRLVPGYPALDLDESRNGKAETTATETLKCSWSGCRSNKTFKRKYEYNRHMKKHTRTVSLPCPVVYCPRQGSRSFYRWDKLFDHLRTGHTEDETCRCLVDGCTAPQMPLNLLRLHARYHGVDVNRHPELATSCDFLKVLRSFSMARKCDLKKCKRWFGADEAGYLQEHLLRHSLEDRRSQSNIIRAMGYDPISAEILCPICQQSFADFLHFVSHLETAHLTTDSAHWVSFKRHVPADFPTATRYIWQGWENENGSSEDCYCGYCGDYASSRGSTWVDHHLALLATSDEIKLARARILRLLPSFGDHPVFEADMPTVHLAT